MRFEPLDACFGAVVTGFDLRLLSESTVPSMNEAWLEFGLLVFPGQHLDRSEQDNAARHFGDLEFTATALTNVRRDGSVRADPLHSLNKSLKGNERWHHDSTYMPVQAKGALFTAEVVTTSGGATGFADMRAAYDALETSLRTKLDRLAAHHSRRRGMERAGLVVSDDDAGAHALYGFTDDNPPLRPIVKVHPETGRPNLLIGQHAVGIVGLTTDESELLLDQLNDAACAPEFTYHHQWTVGDAALWDNRRLMHRATAHDLSEPRRMWHTRIAGDPSTESGIDLQA